MANVLALDPIRERALEVVQDWYEFHRAKNGAEPQRFVISAGLVIAERLREDFPLRRGKYVTDGNQLRGSSGANIQRILSKHGEVRPLSSEGGRTTRGSVPAADLLAEELNQISELKMLDSSERGQVADTIQAWLAQRAIEFFNRKRLVVDLDANLSVEAAVGRILQAARDAAENKGGAVAQHLVGAKLAIRFRSSGIEIENHPTNAADLQTGRSGDFKINDTIFHVTLAPGQPVIEKCRENLRQGFRVVLLVTDDSIAAARQLARLAGILDRISFGQSLGGFIGQNIEELGQYSKSSIHSELSELLHVYNERVAAVEMDRSLLLEIPQWLIEAKPKNV